MFDSKVLDAVKLVAYLNSLAEMTKNGFFPFSECEEGNREIWREAVVYIDEPNDGRFAELEVGDVTADVVVDECHHDVISGYGALFTGLCGYNCQVKVRQSDENKQVDPSICITFEDPDKTMFVVEGGTWYMG